MVPGGGSPRVAGHPRLQACPYTASSGGSVPRGSCGREAQIPFVRAKPDPGNCVLMPREPSHEGAAPCPLSPLGLVTGQVTRICCPFSLDPVPVSLSAPIPYPLQMREREVKLWDTRHFTTAVASLSLDTSQG